MDLAKQIKGRILVCKEVARWVNSLNPNMHIQVLITDLYFPFKNELREFDKRSNHFLFADHFINSHNLSS